MTILIKQAKIVDPQSPHNGLTRDLFIANGIIQKIVENYSGEADKIVAVPGLHVSPGWMDVFAHFADPGYEFKETIETGSRAAASGGFTDVLLLPNTKPAVDNKAAVEYLIQKNKTIPVTIHPIGAITKNTDGKELAEMYDMKNSGALTFSDGIHPVQSAGLLLKALQYVSAFNGTIIQLPDDKSISPHGAMNEGIVSTQLGLPGKPAMAEELMVVRDIKLAQYAGSKLHFTGISTRKSLEYIQQAKDNGVAITCSVAPYHLCYCDKDLHEYNTQLKVNPPLRTKADMEAMQIALQDGLIDCIASHHLPQEYDSKIMEFEYAKFGMTGLETAYAALNTTLPSVKQEKWVELFSIHPRAIFGLPPHSIVENGAAIITLYDPACEWEVTERSLQSKSKNTAFIGRTLRGRALGIINNHQSYFS